MKKNELIRIARIESVCNKLRAEMDDVVRNAYLRAVENNDEETAALLARKIRNALLDKSDKECVLDKMLPDAPIGSSFTDWIDWLKALAQIKKNAWGEYRQALRDLSQQKGFPFEIEFPKAPNEIGDDIDG
jgi:hypothetical protein